MKLGSRSIYERAWNKFKEFSSEDFATTTPSVQQFMACIIFLRESRLKSVPALPGPTLSQAVFVKVLEGREGIEVQRS